MATITIEIELVMTDKVIEKFESMSENPGLIDFQVPFVKSEVLKQARPKLEKSVLDAVMKTLREWE